MDRYEVMTGKMMPLTDGAHRKWGFTGKVVTRSYERLVDALIDFVETGDGLKARFLTGFAACLAADRKSVENRGFGVVVRKVRCHRGEDGTDRVSSVETIGSVIYWTVEVERRVEYKENEWLPCDESGRIDDGYGNGPNATVAYLSSLEGSREERAFELAKNEYLAWLEHKADRYTTVYGYMGLGDRYEQHLL